MIPEVGDRGTPGYRPECQESFRSKSIDMLRIGGLFGSVISFGSEQNFIGDYSVERHEDSVAVERKEGRR